MKKIYLLLLFVCIKAYAQIPFNVPQKHLDKNYVKAGINGGNSKFWNINGNNKASYEVPKGKGTHAQFAGSLWIGGFDTQGQLHLSAETYRQAGIDFWPGPLDTADIDVFNAANNTPYNRLWKVDCDDINNFVTAYNAGSVTAGTYTVPADIADYPAKGNGNFQRYMADFYDAGNNGQYSPATQGNYPLIKGHQQILSIYNDNNGTHSETHALPMGLEIHERAYCYFDPNLHDTMQAVNYTTFYHYTIYNRSNNRYNNVFIGIWSDVDLGYYADDYIGTDTLNNFTYCYNGDNNDQNYGSIISGGIIKGYGTKPPVISNVWIDTDCSNDGIDNDLDGTIDEPDEHFELNASSYYNNNIGAFPPATTNPTSAINYYGYMSGRWKDSTLFTYGGNAYGGTVPTKFVYTGNPADSTGWTEATAGNTPGDRRIISSSGGFQFPANTKIEFAYAVVFSQDTSQEVNTITQFNTRVQRDVRNVRYYDKMHQQPQCAPAITYTPLPPPPPTGIKENENALFKAIIYPNPSRDKVNIVVSENINFADVTLLDVSGRVISKTIIHENHRAVLNVSEIDTGIYFVEISNGNSKITHKLIKD